jgi:hypothetical protein
MAASTANLERLAREEACEEGERARGLEGRDLFHTHTQNTTQRNVAFPQLSVAILACLGKTTGFSCENRATMGVFMCGVGVWGGGQRVLTMCPARRIVRKWKLWLTPVTL